MGDDEVEVDVKLFITCRMCLDAHGVYQIVPSLRKLIKFCFEIDIKPFDGLPQLICKKCKSTLTEYYEKKTRFMKIQQQLKEKLIKTNDETPLPEANNYHKTNGAEKSPNSPIVVHEDVASQYRTKQTTDAWKKAYDEHYVCRICSKSYQKLSSIKKHTNTHKIILKKHKNVFRNYCMVQLNKIDKKPNSTGCSNLVVYDKNKVILDKGNSLFHSFCLRKSISDSSDSEEEVNEISGVKRRASFDSEDDICKGKKKRKTRRLFSSSSTRTTVLGDSKVDCNASNDATERNALNNCNSADLVHAECISIDDTPSECATKNKLDMVTPIALRQQKTPKATIANYKAIQSIVTMCHKKYKKKVESENNTINKPSEYSLKHKILSLGRKVINKQGVGCTGLLRYMEHKDLEVTWNSATQTVRNKGPDFVRIMPKIKSRQNSDNNEIGWKNLHEISFLTRQVVSDKVNESDVLDVAVVPKTETIEEESPSCPLDAPQEDQSDQFSTNDLYNKNKLLNKTPVANPKQLPKKIGLIENKPIPNDSTMLQPFEVDGETASEEVEDNNFGLPIITSTTSLSKTFVNDTEADQVTDKPTPRIKVKPASELMTERALNNQAASADAWAINSINESYINVPLTSSTVYVASPVSQTQANHQPVNHLVSIIADPSRCGDDKSLIDETNLTDSNDKKLEFVTLDCLEVPNTKTDSPFRYFTMVLIRHGLILMDINEELPSNFNCLVKFKLVLKQDSKLPLGVMLSLFCSHNLFCFNFKDSKLKNFDPNQLPAFWQWELLKVYKGDVVNKILQNAMKISKEVHENTKQFLSLLKSIQLIT